MAETVRKRLTDGAGGQVRPGRLGEQLARFIGVNLVTPRGVVAHEDTDAITAPGELGEFEMLPGHVPALTALRPGVLTIGEKKKTKYAVSAGYLRIDAASAVEILVEQAVLGSEVDVEAARTDLKAAEAELAKWGADKPADGDYINLVHNVQWAKARLEAAGSPATSH
jgi:F-type H+-transporting ATPase subunit epsilon